MYTVVAVVAVVLGATSQAITGFGFSLVSAPFLLAAYRSPLGVQLNLLLSFAVNVGLLARRTADVQRRAVVQLLVPAALCAVVLGLVVRLSATNLLTIAGGTICLASVLAVALGRSSERLRHPWAAAGIGAVSGGMNVTSGVGGPPVVLYALTAGWPDAAVRPTMQAFFLGSNLVALVVLGWPAEIPPAVVVALVVGVLIGRRVADKVNGPAVRRASLVVAGVGSVLAIARGVGVV